MLESASPKLRVLPPPVPDPVDTLFRSHSRYVAAIALRLLGREDEVDDVVQEVFMAALGRLAGLREPEALRGWLATITVRTVLGRLRRRRVRALLWLDHAPDYTEISRSANPEEAALVAQVYRLLDQIPVQERLAWTLRRVQGESLERVAELCGCSLATVKRRIAAAQSRLGGMVNDG